MATDSSIRAWRRPGTEEHGVTKSWTLLSTTSATLTYDVFKDTLEGPEEAELSSFLHPPTALQSHQYKVSVVGWHLQNSPLLTSLELLSLPHGWGIPWSSG